MLQIDVDIEQAPLLVYGYLGVRSCVDVVAVSRALPGNRQVLFSFVEFVRLVREPQPRKRNFTTLARHRLDTSEATLQLHLSTPSRANYRDIGQRCHDNAEHFFDIASSRVAPMSHAEGRSFSARDVDQRLQQSTSALPIIPAGGVVELRVQLPIAFLFERAFPALVPPRTGDAMDEN